MIIGVELILTLLSWIFLVIFGIYSIYLMGCMALFMLSVYCEIRPDVEKWGRRTLYNPFNSIVFVWLLTPAGRASAKEYWRAVVKLAAVALVLYGWFEFVEHVLGKSIFLVV